ncbi:alanine racemase [uncultured Tessaracoccus sp.]|uniref:alanine racemase n=1 Tax=uncultured Tessaracoccus sp. TaxID=905023 RepID=UPI0025D125F5|nr:alanine racemase [uncultured Tessaracoccus sp.]
MHNTEFVVDLEAIAHNLDTVRRRGGGRACIAAVKANAYGHGAVPVARRLEPLVEGFGVATVGEALELRAAGITCMVLKLSPANVDELPAAVGADVSLVVGAPEQVPQIAAAARASGTTARVHLKIDTGMHRVGVAPEQAADVARAIVDEEALRLEGVMTHFAVADVEEGDAFTALQRARFVRAVAAVRAVSDVRWVHSGNSAGILNHDLGDDTAIRPGIALYGSAPERNLDEPGLLRPCARWTTRVTGVRRIAEGEGISYGLTWHAPRDTTVATLAVGYGDGYSRLLSNRGRVLIGGRAHAVVGRVCMDQTLVDLGDRDDVRPGDEVVLLGASGDERITPQELADCMGTIPYEVTCLVTGRVPRRHVG